MIKFGGTKLPGGIELNGRQYYDDGEREIADIRSRMAMEYELPPLDFIGWHLIPFSYKVPLGNKD